MRATIALLGVCICWIGSALENVQAGVIVQTRNFSNEQTESGSGRIIHAGDSGLVGQAFNPFSSSRGVLDSFTIEWTKTVVASGTTDATAGSFSISLGGSYRVGTSSYTGNGGGNGGSADPGTAIPEKTATVTNTYSFLPSNANVTYDPNILSQITGGSPFDLSYWGGVYTISTYYENMATITSRLTGSVKLTYNYTATVPEPASMWIGASLLAGTVGFRRFRKKA